MARCFLTGVEFSVQDGYVLNRSDSYRLLRTLKNRAESLERLVSQLSPLDDRTPDDTRAVKLDARKQHRMVCKAIADAIGATYPEIELFLSWSALLARQSSERMRLLKEHPIYGPGISRTGRSALRHEVVRTPWIRAFRGGDNFGAFAVSHEFVSRSNVSAVSGAKESRVLRFMARARQREPRRERRQVIVGEIHGARDDRRNLRAERREQPLPGHLAQRHELDGRERLVFEP